MFGTLQISTMARALVVASLTFTIGCSQQAQPTDANATQAQIDISQGYAQLFQTANGLSNVNALLYIKLESDAVDRFITGLSEDMAQMATATKQATRSAPWIDLDATGLPRIEQMKRSKSQLDRALGLAPVFGRTGADFERTLLLTLSGGLNQSRYLTRVLLELETDDSRKAFLEQARDTFDRLYDADVDLLNSRYFCNAAADQPITDDAASRDFDGDEGGDSDNVRRGPEAEDGPTQGEVNAQSDGQDAQGGSPRDKGGR